MSENQYEFSCDLLYETDDAYKVSDGVNEYWIPKSMAGSITMFDEIDMLIVIPEWLAIVKGII